MKIVEVYNDKLAKLYDEATQNKWFAPIEAYKLLTEFDLIGKKLAVLDLGVGTGQSIGMFVDKDCDIYGVDISSEMLSMTRQKYPKLKTIKYDIAKGLSELKFKDNFFDVVIAVGVLEFVEDITMILNDVFRLLKSDGYLLFTYELLLDDNKYQNSKNQGNSDGYIENPPTIANFDLYRRSKKEMSDKLSGIGYKVLRHYKIKAFNKGPDRIPVYYGVVLACK